MFYILKCSIIFEICGVMMSIDTWGGVDYWIYVLNGKLFGHESWATNRMTKYLGKR